MKVFIVPAADFEPDSPELRLRTLLDALAEKQRSGETSVAVEDEICRELGVRNRELAQVIARLRRASKQG